MLQREEERQLKNGEFVLPSFVMSIVGVVLTMIIGVSLLTKEIKSRNQSYLTQDIR